MEFFPKYERAEREIPVIKVAPKYKPYESLTALEQKGLDFASNIMMCAQDGQDRAAASYVHAARESGPEVWEMMLRMVNERGTPAEQAQFLAVIEAV